MPKLLLPRRPSPKIQRASERSWLFACVWTPLVFAVEKTPSLQDEQDKLKMLQDIKNAGDLTHKILREDYCVNRIYRSFIDDSTAREILAEAPVFTPRGKLVKDYLLGIKQVKG